MSKSDQDPRVVAYDKARAGREIKVTGGELHSQADELETVLRAHGECGVYQRGGQLVEISTVPAKVHDGVERAEDAHVIIPITSTRLRDLGTRHGHWTKYDGRKQADKPVDCPKDVAETLAARSTWRLPVLVAVLGAPTICNDGKIINKPGYDEDTGVYLHINEWKEPQEKPTREDAVKARENLEDLVSEFPFVDEAARATWLAALLTALTRWSLRTAPFFGFDAPVMGSGKTLLATLIGLLIHGREPAAMDYPRDEAEARKGLLAALMSGDPVLLLDNIEHTLSGEVLCSVATSESYRARLLGQSRIVTVSTAVTIMLTGNNMLVRGDLSTRLLISRLDPASEHPEERTFKRDDIRQYTLDHREDLVNAALTILRAYQLAGRPNVDMPPFGRFEDWSARVRAPLIWSGAADPCETRARVETGDPEREQLGALLNAWWACYEDREVLVKGMISDVISSTAGDNEHDLRDAMHNIAGEGNKINSRRLSSRLSRWEGRVQDGMRIRRDRMIHKTWAWRIERMGGDSTDQGDSSTHKIRKTQTNNGTVQREIPQIPRIPPAVREAVTKACEGLKLTPDEFLDKLDADDQANIESGEMTGEQLRSWAEHFDGKLKNG